MPSFMINTRPTEKSRDALWWALVAALPQVLLNAPTGDGRTTITQPLLNAGYREALVMAQLVDGLQEDLPLSIAEPKDRIVLAIDAGNPRYRGGHDHLHTFRAGSSTPIGYREWVCSEREKARQVSPSTPAGPGATPPPDSCCTPRITADWLAPMTATSTTVQPQAVHWFAPSNSIAIAMTMKPATDADRLTDMINF
jgi:hypothetical protein